MSTYTTTMISKFYPARFITKIARVHGLSHHAWISFLDFYSSFNRYSYHTTGYRSVWLYKAFHVRCHYPHKSYSWIHSLRLSLPLRLHDALLLRDEKDPVPCPLSCCDSSWYIHSLLRSAHHLLWLIRRVNTRNASNVHSDPAHLLSCTYY